LLLNWRRVRFTLIASIAVTLPLALGWKSGLLSLLLRTLMLGFVAMLAFGLFEQWPKRLPAWLARWVLQVLGVAVAMPLATFVIYVLSTKAGAPPFWADKDRLDGFFGLSMMFVLLAPWAALAALVRQKDALARHQALAFDLERSELERQASDARLHLLQAQVAPHFLFNTLANVQALVDAGSPQASAVLRSLIAYLRAAVPRLNEPATTLGQELQLVQAYLELMHMRMPDRLQFALNVDDAARTLRCPPMTLLTLVENAVKHGIDPCCDDGTITIRAREDEGRLTVSVTDTGEGILPKKGTGVGLSNIRERLKTLHGTSARLILQENEPHGVVAAIEIDDNPAEEALPAPGGTTVPA
jgi:hypothetical protein